MMLLSLHIVSIAALIAISGGIAYSLGKNEGIRITRMYYEELDEPQDPIAQADTKSFHAEPSS
ncbi:MAG: hypothetical protein HN867_17545 [Deltaproteobacteria bacterium]|jgi:hypothetical protein|nr:hypothetical protein [Deltaproteobacteria bacterium]MBT7205269.1 hypothetical protein [Deltaproteobacteria bacterium]